MLALLEAPLPSSSPFSLVLSIVLLGGGLALLLVGAHFLVDSATVVASRLGVSPLVIGLTVIAFGTSAPELALNVVAAASSEAGANLAFGNVIGSNIANIGLVLAIACLVHPVMARRSVRFVYFPLLIATEGAVLLIAAASDEITRTDGILLLCGLPVALIILRRFAGEDQDEPVEVASPEDSRGLAAAGLIVLGLGMLLTGAKLSELGAVSIARHFELSEAVIGLTIVAVATSLPESFTAIIAARRKQSDLALGTVIGSNLFNILSVLAITSLVRPVPIPHDVGWGALTVMAVLTLSIGVIYISRPRPLGAKRPALGLHTLSKPWGGVILTVWVGAMIWWVAIGG